jgi:hypothetical protein
MSKEEARINSLAKLFVQSNIQHLAGLLYSFIGSIAALMAFAANIWIIDLACDQQFIDLGYRIYLDRRTESGKIPNAVIDVFPGFAQCNGSRIGVAGTREEQDVQCALTMAGHHQVFFILLWLSYAAISGLSVTVICTRLIAIWFKCGRRC